MIGYTPLNMHPITTSPGQYGSVYSWRASIVEAAVLCLPVKAIATYVCVVAFPAALVRLDDKR